MRGLRRKERRPCCLDRKKPAFSISIARGALESIFDECDKYDADETGGRLLGTYRHKNGRYDIEVKGVLEPGPNAQRSPTYFLQDGDYQEKQFRAIEASHPDIEHLGNWHTHHVNGYPTLSGGDKATYFKTVNHEKHNTDFFYALLVVGKNRGGNPRYDDQAFHLPPRRRRRSTRFRQRDVRLVDAPPLRPPMRETLSSVRDPPPDRIGSGAEPRAGKGSGVFRRVLSRPEAAPLEEISAPPTGRDRCRWLTARAPTVVAMEDARRQSAVLFDRQLLPRIRRSPTSLSSTRTANFARRGTPCCIWSAISIRRFIADKKGQGT